MLRGGCRVTRSLHRTVPWVSRRVAYQQESRHLAGAAARWGSGAGRRRFVGINFPFVTSGPLRVFPGRTCLPGDNLDASASPTGDRQSPALAKTPPPPSNPPFIWRRRTGRSPSAGPGAGGAQSPWDPCTLAAGRSMPPLRGASRGMQAWLAPRLRHGCRSFWCQPRDEQEESLLPAPWLRKRRRR